MHSEKSPRGRLVCPLCSLVLGCQGKACLCTCCLSPGVCSMQVKACQWSLSHVWGMLMHKYKNSHKLSQTPHPPPPCIIFPCARRQTTSRHTSLSLEPLSVDQGTDYTKTGKSSPGAPLRAPGDRLHIERQAFLWDPSQSAPEDM